MWLASWALVWVSGGGGCVGSYLPSVCVCCVCVCMQLPADFSRLHLADGLHPQVTHVSSSHSGCSITSDSGSSSLSDIYQVRMPPWRCGSPVWTPLDSSSEAINTFFGLHPTLRGRVSIYWDDFSCFYHVFLLSGTIFTSAATILERLLKGCSLSIACIIFTKWSDTIGVTG